MAKVDTSLKIYDPSRWGLSDNDILLLSQKLRICFDSFKIALTTATRNTSEYGFDYLEGLITLDRRKNYSNISREVNSWDDDSQQIQHFMSDSPWRAEDVFEILQSQIKEHSLLQDGILTLDESGDPCSGFEKAGASRQHIGRTGSVQKGQVGVVLGYYANEIWSMVDADFTCRRFGLTKNISGNGINCIFLLNVFSRPNLRLVLTK
jgi:SRSO17 transposase